MRFGTRVEILRGSERNPSGSPGCLRKVPGILLGRRGRQAHVRLLQDDPLAVDYCTKKGDSGWWPQSAVSLPRAERGAYDCDNCNDRGSVVDGSGERVRCWACR